MRLTSERIAELLRQDIGEDYTAALTELLDVRDHMPVVAPAVAIPDDVLGWCNVFENNEWVEPCAQPDRVAKWILSLRKAAPATSPAAPAEDVPRKALLALLDSLRDHQHHVDPEWRNGVEQILGWLLRRALGGAS